MLPTFRFRFFPSSRELGTWTCVGRAGRPVYKEPESAVLVIVQVRLNVSAFRNLPNNHSIISSSRVRKKRQEKRIVLASPRDYHVIVRAAWLYCCDPVSAARYPLSTSRSPWSIFWFPYALVSRARVLVTCSLRAPAHHATRNIRELAYSTCNGPYLVK